MKTSELIKQAEEILRKCSDGPWKISNYRPDQIIRRSPNDGTYEKGDNNFSPLFYLEDFNAAHLLVFARNHMQELIDRLKRYEKALTPFVMHKAPCMICGYNGGGYYQAVTHKCAEIFHEVTDPISYARKALKD